MHNSYYNRLILHYRQFWSQSSGFSLVGTEAAIQGRLRVLFIVAKFDSQIISMSILSNSEYDQEIPQSHTADQPTAP